MPIFTRAMANLKLCGRFYLFWRLARDAFDKSGPTEVEKTIRQWKCNTQKACAHLVRIKIETPRSSSRKDKEKYHALRPSRQLRLKTTTYRSDSAHAQRSERTNSIHIRPMDISKSIYCALRLSSNLSQKAANNILPHCQAIALLGSGRMKHFSWWNTTNFTVRVLLIWNTGSIKLLSCLAGVFIEAALR